LPEEDRWASASLSWVVEREAELGRKLRGVADEYMMHVNRDRPEHHEAIMAPSIVPAE
jgi:hypothetical protein